MGILKPKILIYCVLLGNLQLVFSQNLIQNPSFENYIECPVKLGNLEKDVEDWQIPTLGSTDYFNACSEAMGTPKNFNGEQPANFGTGYVGFYMLAPDNYREYVQGSLLTTLKKGEPYTVSFYVSLAEASDFAIKEFGIRFAEFPVKVETNKVLSAMHLSKLEGDTSNFIKINYSDFYDDEKKWILLSKEFIAKGTENFIIIGNFQNDKRTQKNQTKRNINKGSYYYLDMVAVFESRGTTDSVADVRYQLDAVHVFKDVLFNFNRATLKKTDQTELRKVLLYLTKNPAMQIKIGGHTDAVGSASFNQELSLNRARTVAEFLMENGIEESRIHYQGFGSSLPVASNKTKAGRLRNRRVEFVLVE